MLTEIQNMVMYHVEFERLQELLRDVTYKPGAQFRVHAGILGTDHAICLHIGLPVPKVQAPEEIDFVNNYYTIDPARLAGMSNEQVLQMVYEQALFLETHELNEWFKFRGKNLVDPHPEWFAEPGHADAILQPHSLPPVKRRRRWLAACGRLLFSAAKAFVRALLW